MTDSDLMPLRDCGSVLFCAVINSCSSCEKGNEEVAIEASKSSQGYKFPWIVCFKTRLSNNHFVIKTMWRGQSQPCIALRFTSHHQSINPSEAEENPMMNVQEGQS